MQKAIWISLAFVVLASCAGSRKNTGNSSSKEEEAIKQQATSLDGQKWMLAKLHKDGTVQGVVNKKPFIRFDQVKGSAGGNGSCNSFGSTLTVSGSSISISQIFSTKMYCEGVQGTENSFLDLLGKVNRYEIKGDQLSLYRDKEVLLEFVKE
jgi:heat shock protein HslJ